MMVNRESALLYTDEVTIQFGGLTAVDHVNITVMPLKVTALIGPNGAGKTTFFNSISGVYVPNHGSVIFDGQHMEGKRGYLFSAAGISRTFQNINLFWKMSVLENVLVGMHPLLKSNLIHDLFRTSRQRKEDREAMDKAHEWLQFVGLDDMADYQADSLSYGQQRLLEIVRGLASNPKLILLDEPAAGMNTAEKRVLDGIMKRIINELGVTILIVEHDMKLVMDVSDYIFVLNSGKLLAQGTPDEIQNNPDVITAYLGGE